MRLCILYMFQLLVLHSLQTLCLMSTVLQKKKKGKHGAFSSFFASAFCLYILHDLHVLYKHYIIHQALLLRHLYIHYTFKTHLRWDFQRTQVLSQQCAAFVWTTRKYNLHFTVCFSINRYEPREPNLRQGNCLLYIVRKQTAFIINNGICCIPVYYQHYAPHMQLIFKYRYIVCCLPNLFFKSSDAIRMNSYYINCTCDLVTESSVISV